MPEPRPTTLLPNTPSNVRTLLQHHGLRPSKNLGQNFLLDANMLRFIAEAGGAAPGVFVLEVGPGLGGLTHAICQCGATVRALEKDTRLGPALQAVLQDQTCEVIFTDALLYDYTLVPQGAHLIANLPYYISTALITAFLSSNRFERITVLVQREVAERLVAKPGQDQYGFLSAITALSASTERLRDVPKQLFYPAPDVTSSVVRITPNGTPPSPELIRTLEVVLHHRRKTIRNNLRLGGFEETQTLAALTTANIAPEARAEDVSLDAIAVLSAALHG